MPMKNFVYIILSSLPQPANTKTVKEEGAEDLETENYNQSLRNERNKGCINPVHHNALLKYECRNGIILFNTTEVLN